MDGLRSQRSRGHVELKKRERSNFRFSVLRVLDPSTAGADVNAVESHYKTALGTRTHGLNKDTNKSSVAHLASGQRGAHALAVA